MQATPLLEHRRPIYGSEVWRFCDSCPLNGTAWCHNWCPVGKVALATIAEQRTAACDQIVNQIVDQVRETSTQISLASKELRSTGANSNSTEPRS